MNLRDLFSLANKIEPSQLWNLIIVAIQKLPSQFHLYFFNNILSIAKFFSQSFNFCLAWPTNNILVQLLIQNNLLGQSKPFQAIHYNSLLILIELKTRLLPLQPNQVVILRKQGRIYLHSLLLSYQNQTDIHLLLSLLQQILQTRKVIDPVASCQDRSQLLLQVFQLVLKQIMKTDQIRINMEVLQLLMLQLLLPLDLFSQSHLLVQIPYRINSAP